MSLLYHPFPTDSQTSRGKILQDDWVLSSSFGDVFNDTAQQNGMVDVTSNQYDGQDRLILATAPEGGTIAYTYSPDLEQNVVQVTQVAKPGSSAFPLVTTFTYDPVYNKPTTIIDPLGLITTITYDSSTGNFSSAVADVGPSPHFNARTSFTYNAYGEVVTATDPLGTLTICTYDSFGNPTSITRDYSRLNQLVQLGYSPQGDIVSVTDPNGNTTTSTFDADRQLTGITSPVVPSIGGALTTSFTYDPDGLVLQAQQSLGGTVLRTASASYTLTGELATATDANGNVTQISYDAVDRLASVTDPLNRVTSYSYDAMSRPVAAFNPAIQVAALEQWSYTPDGLLASLSDAAGNTTAFAPDGFDRLETTTYPDGSTETYGYDADSNPVSLTTRRSDTIALGYDTLNRLTSMTPPATTGTPAIAYSYDLDGRLIGTSSNGPAVKGPVPPSGGTVQFAETLTYDPMNRPTSVTWSPAATQATPTAGSVTFTHGYDPTNRRINQAASDNSWWSYPTMATNIGYTPNTLNQYASVAIQGSPTANLTYDANGNLISAATFDPAPTATAGVTNTFTDPGQRALLEYDGNSGTILRWYVYGAGPYELVGQANVSAGTRASLIPDIQGSVIGMLDSGAGALTKQGFRPFGESGNAAGPMGYAALHLDSSGLYNNRARQYSPTLGRFMQTDPIGYGEGNNLYAYVGDDPLNFTDPSGLVKDSAINALTAYGASQTKAAQLQYESYIGVGLLVGRGLEACGDFCDPEFQAGVAGELGPYARFDPLPLTFGGLRFLSTVSKTELAVDEEEAALLRAYGGPGGGHHVPARGAFTGAPGYDANTALAIPNAELVRLGVSHSAVTAAQQTLYRAFSASGQALTWEAVQSIEAQALVRGGMASDVAANTVKNAINALKASGISGPTRIPWGR